MIADTGLRKDSIIDDFFERAKALVVRILVENSLVTTVGEAARSISFSNGKKYSTKVFKSLGFDNRPSPEVINNWVKNNVKLVTNTSTKEVEQLERLFRDKAFTGTRNKDLEREIAKIFKGGRNTVKTIAKDQTGKLSGQLDQFKQENSGIDGYYWRTTRITGRVRPKHAAREGNYYRWDSPPDGGHPGQEINCMCDAEAAIDRVLTI